jgi:hypothetical protein
MSADVNVADGDGDRDGDNEGEGDMDDANNDVGQSVDVEADLISLMELDDGEPSFSLYQMISH